MIPTLAWRASMRPFKSVDSEEAVSCVVISEQQRQRMFCTLARCLYSAPFYGGYTLARSGEASLSRIYARRSSSRVNGELYQQIPS